jgi:cell division initiation protein
MRKALMTAQKIAEETVQNAEQQKAAILAEAEAQAKARTQNIIQEIEAEEYRLAAAKSATATYVASIRGLLEKEMNYLEQLHELVPEQAPATDSVEETAAEIDDNVQRLLAQSGVEIEPVKEEAEAEARNVDLSDTTEFAAVAAEAVREELRENEAFETRRIDFGNLQFGRDYEIK